MEAAEPGYRPLYKQVREILLRRLSDRVWPPGTALPSEGRLALDLRVSQGTVRKALDELAVGGLLVRRQGRGTFVAEHDETRILFQFFKLVPDAGERGFPESRVVAVGEGAGDADERERLGLGAGAAVIRIRRVRSLSGAPVVVERITLPAALFPGLAAEPVPNNLYALFAERFGVSIARSRERLKAVALEAGDAAELGVSAGTPALAVDRIALALDGARVEWRRSFCLTQDHHYDLDLG